MRPSTLSRNHRTPPEMIMTLPALVEAQAKLAPVRDWMQFLLFLVAMRSPFVVAVFGCDSGIRMGDCGGPPLWQLAHRDRYSRAHLLHEGYRSR